MTRKHSAPLWDPKFAAIGVAAIALALFILDFLPGILRRTVEKRMAKANEPRFDLTPYLFPDEEGIGAAEEEEE